MPTDTTGGPTAPAPNNPNPLHQVNLGGYVYWADSNGRPVSGPDLPAGYNASGVGNPDYRSLQQRAIDAIYQRIIDQQHAVPDRQDFMPDANSQNIQNGLYGMLGTTLNAGFNPSQSNATREQQMALIQQLQDQAAGKGPSLAQAQLQQASAQNAAQAASAMTQAHGMGAGAAQRQVGMQRAQIGQELGGQSAIARLQEQMAARGMLGQQLGGMRGQDLSQAQIGSQLSLAGQVATQQARQQALAALLSQSEADRNARIGYQQMRTGAQTTWNANSSGNFGAANAQSNANDPWSKAMQILGMASGAAGTVAGLAGK